MVRARKTRASITEVKKRSPASQILDKAEIPNHKFKKRKAVEIEEREETMDTDRLSSHLLCNGNGKSTKQDTLNRTEEPAVTDGGFEVLPSIEAANVQKSQIFKHGKEKVLVLTSRGIPPRFRHLMLDLLQLLPHSKRDAKLDTKSDRVIVDEVAELKGCKNIVFFEARKHQDMYIWISKTGSGPSVKFHCTNVHTMAELKLSGNHLKGSRPVLSFSKAKYCLHSNPFWPKEFDEQPHWQLVKELLTHIFVTPKNHPRSKPFLDHVINFAVADERIWIRNYQIALAPEAKKATADALTLVEVGPRMTLNPIKILKRSFSGAVLYSNANYVSPNVIRAEARRQKSERYTYKVQSKQKSKKHSQKNVLPISELHDTFRS